LRNRVVAALKEGVTTQNAEYGKKNTDKKSSCLKRLQGIGGAGGIKPARWGDIGGDPALIKFN